MKRIGYTEAVEKYLNEDLWRLGMAASAARFEHNPQPDVTYVVDRNINYTNACQAECRFCEYHCKVGSSRRKVLSEQELFSKVDELVAVGGTQVLLQGGLDPELRFDDMCQLVHKLTDAYPNLSVHGFSPAEIAFFASNSQLSIKEVLSELWCAGMRTIPGGGAEILVDRVRKTLSPGKIDSNTWVEVMESAHQLGFKTTATMVFGTIETIAERMQHLELLRALQDRTGGFTAFIVWPMQGKWSIFHRKTDQLWQYLRTVAIARLYLDNFPHIQASWVTMGAAGAQMALMCGADDVGGTMMEENVVRAAGCVHQSSEEDLRTLIAEAGFPPRKRDTLYHIL